MTESLVTYTIDAHVGIVCLNRPDKLNAISLELEHLLVEKFDEIRERDGLVAALRWGAAQFGE